MNMNIMYLWMSWNIILYIPNVAFSILLEWDTNASNARGIWIPKHHQLKTGIVLWLRRESLAPKKSPTTNLLGRVGLQTTMLLQGFIMIPKGVSPIFSYGGRLTSTGCLYNHQPWKVGNLPSCPETTNHPIKKSGKSSERSNLHPLGYITLVFPGCNVRKRQEIHGAVTKIQQKFSGAFSQNLQRINWFTIYNW